jgi:very-short-patch-repair endonuclease
LTELGVGRGAIARRIRNRELHRIHRGVYAVGHPGLSVHGRLMAAVLACGDGACLSHRSAAQLWKLLERVPDPIDVSVPTTTGRSTRQGIRVHRREALTGRAVTSHLGIPVTAPAQTLEDLRRCVPPAQLRRAVRQAEVRGLETGLARAEPTRSELEDRFLRLCRRHRIPAPEVNVRVGGYEVDFLWRAPRLVVETDGYRYHRGRQAFELDRTRDLELHSKGFDVRHFSYSQVTETPRQVAVAVERALRR